MNTKEWIESYKDRRSNSGEDSRCMSLDGVHMKNIAVILASGKGSRFGAKMPKQFYKLAGKPVLSYTLSAFQQNKNIDEIIIATLEEYIELVNEIVITERATKVTKVVVGGSERYESSWSAIESIGHEECNILFHDAVRPFVSQRIINDCIEALAKFNAVDVAVDPTDTIILTKDDVITSIPDRRFLKRGQTPQAFKMTTIRSAYEKFMASESKVASDDCGIVMRFLPNEPINVVRGEEANFKITHQQDIYLADNIIRDGLFVSLTYDESLVESAISGKTVVVFGGSSGIGEAIVVQARGLGANVYSFSRSSGVDISKYDQISKALNDVVAKDGKIDFVVNCAGMLVKKPLDFISHEEIISSIGVNYFGAVNIAKAAYSELKKSKGMLVSFSSSSFTRGRSTYSIYSSTKAAIVNFTQAISEEWSLDDIRVNCINPERTDTPMRRSNFGIESPETLLTATEVARSTLSVMASDVTGMIISVKK